MTCVFCEICEGEEKADIVFQNQFATCFLPRRMEVSGHLIVVPNVHYENIYDISEEALCEVFKVVKYVSYLVQKKLGAKGVNILNANGKSAQQSVSHFHIHILPRYENDGVDAWPKLEIKKFGRDEIIRKLVEREKR